MIVVGWLSCTYSSTPLLVGIYGDQEELIMVGCGLLVLGARTNKVADNSNYVAKRKFTIRFGL